MRTHGAVVGRRFRSLTKLTTKVRIGRGYLWANFLIAAAALQTPTRNGYNAQGVNLKSIDRLADREVLGLLTPSTPSEDMHTYISIYPSIYLSMYLCIHLSFYPSNSLSIYRSIDELIERC